MRVQHPEKRQHSITPVGVEPIETDENGVADVDDEFATREGGLLEQGWTEIKSGKSAADKER